MDSVAVESVVVVGAGLAGARAVQALREKGHTGSITLVGAEPHLPYDRPPLSKAVLLGRQDDTTLDVDLAALDVRLLLGHRAVVLHPDEVEVERPGAGTDRLGFDRLLVATGAAPVRLPGVDGVPGVHVLRTVEHARTLRAAFVPGARVAVVGAGWIGAEVTTAAARAGCRVTVVEAAPCPLAGALPPEVGEATRGWYAQAGADLRLATPVESLEPGTVHLAGGERVPFDVAVVGVGVRPETGWLDGSAVRRDERGSVLTDGHLATSAPNVYAAGDCAAFASRRYGTVLAVEHWDDALRAPDVAAAAMLGAQAVHDPVPYFWSEQFGRMVQYAGHHPAGRRTVWRGDPAGGFWAVFWLDKHDRLAAALTVDRPRDLVQARRIMERDGAVDPEMLADPEVPVRSLVRP